MARLRKRMDRGGRFLLDYTDVDGCRYQIDTGTTVEALAQLWLAKCQERLSLARLGQIEKVGKFTVEIIQGRQAKQKQEDNRIRLTRFKEIYKERGDLEFNLSHNTKEIANYAFDSFISLIGDKFLSDITSDDVLKWKKQLRAIGKSLTTESMYGRGIRTAMNRAVRWGFIEKNPFAQVEFPTRQHTRRKDAEMSPAEIQKLFKTIEVASDIPFLNYVKCVAYTGCRRNEILELRGEDVDMQKRILTVTVTKRKGTPERVQLPISDALYRVLAGMEIKKGEYLFKTQSNSRGAKKKAMHWHQSHVTSTFKEMAVKAGLPKHTLHGLRHSFITLLHEQGVPTSIIQKLVTHKSPRLTSDTYDHTTALDYRKYASLLDFESDGQEEK